ncbi:ABC transporter permease [Paracidobacterium acidisoli]|uniref:ABC transporter permease n=1 Tax=Paracidobacterium acidisoli TaxID=2303751 RepID=A0A372ITI5_9BACT|nr:FtsX-like permease family protein [Paracidobacterium acidisoli]MBT9330650.1 FtsX-like permease family protein [Paracidobacterium acidisoli]
MSGRGISEDAKPALPWMTAARIAWRELHASKAKFVFVLLSVAVGVAALTGVRGFSESFRRTLLTQARSIMAADLSARMNQQATAQQMQQLQALQTHGVTTTAVTEMVSMASREGDPVPLLVSLKVVDPAMYPFYGAVVLSPAGDLRSVLTDATVVVDDNLLVRLQAKIGDRLKVGGKYFRIAAVIAREPDRINSGVGLGPRVMMTRGAVEETGLLQAGSRATERYLFRIDTTKASVADVRTDLEKILPEAQITDFRETSPALTEGIDRSTGLLSLICLVAMVLGVIGVAMAMHAHLQQRIEVLAIMKSIGARSSDILRIYLLQTLFLGVGGALIGVAIGAGVEYAFPSLLGSLVPVHTEIHLPVKVILAAVGTGVLTTLLFCLPPLLDVRRIRPVVVLRRVIESGEGQRSFVARVKERKLQIGAIVVIVAALGGIAAVLSDSMLVGKWFAVCLTALLVVILGLSALTLRGLRLFLARTRLYLHSAVRHGLANLYRPGNQSSAVLAALGTGVMLILSVFFMQSSVLAALREGAGPKTPNLFLVDIGSEELQGVEALLKKQPGLQGPPEMIPIISSRVVSIDGKSVESLELEHYPKRFLRSVPISWADAVPPGAKVVEGKWWQDASVSEVAVVNRVAQRLHLHAGSQVTFAVGEKEIPVRVAAIYKVDGEHAFARSEFVLASGLLRDQPTVWYGAVHVQRGTIPDFERAMFAAYPTVTVINIADIIDTVQGVIDQITIVIRFLAGFSILSGLVILASSVASTRFRRIREVVVLKTLGATRNRIAAVFSVEFLVLGLLAGGVGALFANLLSRILLHRMDVTFHTNWQGTLIAIPATALLAILTGWIASFRILGQKPLEVLREEN